MLPGRVQTRLSSAACRLAGQTPQDQRIPEESDQMRPLIDYNDEAKHLSTQIGPRKVGGRYYNGYSGQEYEVLNIETGRPTWPVWLITVRWADGHTTSHCTAWDPKRDRVLS